MNTKSLLLILILFFNSNYAFCQSQNVEQLLATAEYSSGEKQSNAEVQLGYLYSSGTGGVETNYSKAFSWFKKAALHGNVVAYHNLGWAYYYGNGVQKDIVEAAKWYEKAANLYYGPSALIIGKWYFDGILIKRDYTKAVKYFKIASFKEEGEAMYYYAICYAYGYGITSDAKHALFWASRAIDRNYTDTYWLVGTMYRNGLGVDIDLELASTYYLEGAKKNNSYCQYQLGVMYENGMYFLKDIDKAIEYFTKSSDNGNRHAIWELAGIKAKQNKLSEAIQLYEKSLKEGYARSWEKLVSLYTKTSQIEKIESSLVLFDKCANNEDLNIMAYHFATGQDAPKDEKMAHYLIDEAIRKYPKDLNLKDSKGEIYLMFGDEKNARRIWKQILKIDPSYYNVVSKSVLNKRMEQEND